MVGIAISYLILKGREIKMKAQIIKIDITPKEPCYLCGHAIRTELSKGILDPLYVTVLILQDDKKRSCFLSYDLIMMDEELTNCIKNDVSQIISCKKEHVIVSFIHNHAAPETGEVSVFNDPEKGVRPGYREVLMDAAKQAVISIKDNLEEVSLWYTTTEIDGFYSNRNSKDKPCDKSANIIKLLRNDETMMTMLVNMSCHPTVLGAQNYLISADLFGALRTSLAQAYDCEVFMMQGAAGDMGNRQYRQGNDAQELNRMRDGILPQLRKEFTWKLIKCDEIHFESTHYIMDYDMDLTQMKERLQKTKEELANTNDPTEIKLKSSGAKGLENVIAQGEHVHLEFQGSIIQLGTCVLVSVPCELFNQFGVKIKQSFPNYDVLIWGYCDYSVGYLVEAEEYGKSYESIATQIKKGMSEDYVEYLIRTIRNSIL